MTGKPEQSPEQMTALRLAAIIDSSKDAIIANSIEGIITDWNPAAEKMYGYSAEEVLGKSIAIIAPEGRQSDVMTNMRRMLTGDIPDILEVVRRRKGGELFTTSMSFAVLKDERGEAFGISAIHRDVTEQKLAEIALHEREAQLRLVTDNIPVLVAYIDNDNIVRFANPGYADWMGHRQNEIIGMAVRDLRGPEWYETFRPFAEKNLAGEMTSFEGERELDDGRRVQFSAVNAPHFGDDGEVLGYFVLIMDRTEQFEREEQLRQAQKMEAVGQLTGGVAHEFNNLLMVVVGNLELTLHGATDENTRQFATAAMDGAMRGAELTKQLLAFSRKQVLNVTHVDLNDLVANMQTMLQRTLGEVISVRTDLANETCPVLVDAGQVEATLLNLSLNARDAMPQGGDITVSTANMTLDLNEVSDHPDVAPGDYAVLELADTGAGMNAEVLERVFDPFFTTKDVGQGTGLGLSMVHGFVEQSGGFVEIESKVGEGTKVRIFLPRVRADVNDQESALHGAASEVGLGANVLVVEDDRDVRELVVQLLTQLGCNTIEAEDGETALARMQDHANLDVLFTDVVLPGGISGGDIAQTASELFPDLKLILTSGYPDGEIRDITDQGDRWNFIRKPYRKKELADMFAKVLAP